MFVLLAIVLLVVPSAATTSWLMINKVKKEKAVIIGNEDGWVGYRYKASFIYFIQSQLSIGSASRCLEQCINCIT